MMNVLIRDRREEAGTKNKAEIEVMQPQDECLEPP